METQNSKTVFIEYSSARQGQHFMTVVQTMNHQRIIIGRIYRDYNPETKKTFYKAYDFAGDQIFGNGAEISELKNKFKKTGKLLAEGVLATRKLARQENVRTLNNQKDSRINDIKSIRSKKPEKENDKTKNPEREKVSEKTKLVQMEKEQDAKNTVEYKDLAHIIDKDERSHEKGEPSSNLENPNQEDQFHEEEKSEREMELEQIRSENEEREQDLEIDL